MQKNLSHCKVLHSWTCDVFNIRDKFLRLTTLVLVAILVGLSFDLILQSWSRCEELTARLNQELQDFRDLMSNSDNEE